MQKIYFTLPSGNMLYFDQPWRVPILREDLYLGLKRKYRYLSFVPVTIIQHLVLCRRLAESLDYSPLATAYSSGHDFHEAYFGEWVLGFKQCLPTEFRVMDQQWEEHVLHELGLEVPIPERYATLIKAVDNRALAIETTFWDLPDAPRIQEEQGMPTEAEMRLADDVLPRHAEKWQRTLFDEVWKSVHFREQV
jgi:hypothetical protein